MFKKLFVNLRTCVCSRRLNSFNEKIYINRYSVKMLLFNLIPKISLLINNKQANGATLVEKLDSQIGS